MATRDRVFWGLILTAVGVGLLPISGEAELVDRIAAVVDAEVILESEVHEAVWLYRLQMGIQPEDTTGIMEFRKEVLNQMVDEKLLVAKAQREGMTVGTKELAASVDWAVEEMRRSFPSEEAFLKELEKEGLTLQSLKDRYRDTVRQQLLARKVMERDLRSNLVVTPEEVRAFYETHRDSIPMVPEHVEVLTALVRPQPSTEARGAVERRVDTVLGMLGEGMDFAEVAKEFSDGPEAERGGDIGFFRRGDLSQAPDFEDLAFSLEEGAAGGPVETSLGLHIVKVTARDGDRIRVSQILLRAIATGQDTLRAENVAEEIRTAMANGAEAYEIRDRFAGAVVEAEILGPLPIRDLRPFYQKEIVKLEEGVASEVLVVPEGFQVLRLLSRVPEHEAAYDEIERQLTDLVSRRKMEQAYRKWVDALREEIYIEIKT